MPYNSIEGDRHRRDVQRCACPIESCGRKQDGQGRDNSMRQKHFNLSSVEQHLHNNLEDQGDSHKQCSAGYDRKYK